MAIENVVQLPGTQRVTTQHDNGGGGSGGDGVEARIARVESDVKNIFIHLGDIKTDIRELRSDIKTDFRILWGALFVATIGLAGLLAKGFEWI